MFHLNKYCYFIIHSLLQKEVVTFKFVKCGCGLMFHGSCIKITKDNVKLPKARE